MLFDGLRFAKVIGLIAAKNLQLGQSLQLTPPLFPPGSKDVRYRFILISLVLAEVLQNLFAWQQKRGYQYQRVID